MATTQIINKEIIGNNSNEKTKKEDGKIVTKNVKGDKISTELWMEYFANTLLRENVIDERTHKKLLVKISREVERRFPNK